MKTHIIFATGLLALLGLVGCGSATEADPTPVTVTAPGKTVTITPKPVERAPKIVTVEKTPATCAEALDQADKALLIAGEGFGYAGDGFDAAAEGFDAAANLDEAGMERARRKLQTATTAMGKGSDKLTPVLEAYKTARDACREAN